MVCCLCGLRRWVKSPLSTVAWVQIPRLPKIKIFQFFHECGFFKEIEVVKPRLRTLCFRRPFQAGVLSLCIPPVPEIRNITIFLMSNSPIW